MARARVFSLLAAAGLAMGASAREARATWSIVIMDTRTGEVALASATCLTGFDLQANTPVLLTGVGGATAQSFVDQTGQNRVFIRDQLLLGTPPLEILNGLAARDPGHQTRQYGIGDVMGRMATFTGTGAGLWAGGRTGQVGDLAYAVQGNVLTGAPVVDAAVAAIEQTPGDMADKLYAAMEAARSFGGDGRCSCSPGDPDGCGAPPPPFLKSAHIAYMLIARAGDRDGCNGIYKTVGGPQTTLALDVTGDGRPELLTVCTGGSVVAQRNASAHATPVFLPFGTYGSGSSPRDMAAGDVTGDGITDLVTVASGGNRMYVLGGAADGTFSPVTSVRVTEGPVSVALADFNRDGKLDAAVSNSTSNTLVILRGLGGGNFETGPTMTLGGGLGMVRGLDIGADGVIDVAVAQATAGAVTLMRNDGFGNFSVHQVIATPAGPNGLAVGDLNGDGRADLVVSCGTGNAAVVLMQSPGGVFGGPVLGAPSGPNSVAVGDLNGDGVPDLVISAGGTSSAAGSVTTRMGTGLAQEPFGAARTYALGFSAGRAVVADLDGDGLRDVALSSPSNAGVITVKNLGGGVLNSGLGCATGDYFMEFNVANQGAAAKDPVWQLRERFENWRTGLKGRPDAVQSLVSFPGRSYLLANGHDQIRVQVLLRDWRGADMVFPVTGFEGFHAPGSAMIATVGAPVELGKGWYEVTLTAGTKVGLDRIGFRAEGGPRPVVLMPFTPVPVVAGADFDGDGRLDDFDLMAFLNAFAAGDVDINGDGATDDADYFEFMNMFK
ncbi:MAG: VCBS repeat-containing protein [Phycisphaerae bacterium]|nr:VCBS repeat-containing protein [Phycisphaerae bacterium]